VPVKEIMTSSLDKFCYMGDTIGAGEAKEERVRCVWVKFRELLTSGRATMKMNWPLF